MQHGSSFVTTPRRQTMFGCFNSAIKSASRKKSCLVLAVAEAFSVLIATRDDWSPGRKMASPLKTFPTQAK